MDLPEDSGMELTASQYQVSRPLHATVLLVDLRNFTANLNASEVDDVGINDFCHFLSRFYALCLDCCLVALPAQSRASPPLSVTSTGDGVLVVLYHDEHARYGYLVALLLNAILQVACDHYNRNRRGRERPKTSFGIGVDSGTVSRLKAYPAGGNGVPLIDTFIGECINVAARAEGASKLYSRSNTIIAASTNEILCQWLFGESYATLIQRALSEEFSDDAHLSVQDRMIECNRALCLTYMHHHNLSGVNEPVALFRLAHGSVALGNPRFESLLGQLASTTRHRDEIDRFITGATSLLPST
jgi:class 3 adenylate cyclase